LREREREREGERRRERERKKKLKVVLSNPYHNPLVLKKEPQRKRIVKDEVHR